MAECPCCSGKEFDQCCEPYLNGAKDAPTAEILMRSRYSAYVTANVDYIGNTLSKRGAKDYDEEATRNWAKSSKWMGLEIVKTVAGEEDDNDGTVEFIAKFEHKGEEEEHHEVATFVRESGKWCFEDGKVSGQTYVRQDPKVGRNDPCHCGSGKKFKKCCLK